jgi:hypothetical protein
MIVKVNPQHVFALYFSNLQYSILAYWCAVIKVSWDDKCFLRIGNGKEPKRVAKVDSMADGREVSSLRIL